MGGMDLVRQELQELREKPNLVSEVPVAVSQHALLWPRGTEGMESTLKGELVLFSSWEKGFPCSG